MRGQFEMQMRIRTQLFFAGNEHYFAVVLAMHEMENQTTCETSSIILEWPWREGEAEDIT